MRASWVARLCFVRFVPVLPHPHTFLQGGSLHQRRVLLSPGFYSGGIDVFDEDRGTRLLSRAAIGLGKKHGGANRTGTDIVADDLDSRLD